MDPVNATPPATLTKLERRPQAQAKETAPAPKPMVQDRFDGNQRQGRAKTAGLLAGAGASLAVGVVVGVAVTKLTRSAAMGVGAAFLTAVPGGLIGTMSGLPGQYGKKTLTAGDLVRTGVKGGMTGFITTAWLGPKAWAVTVPATAVSASASHTAAHLASKGEQ